MSSIIYKASDTLQSFNRSPNREIKNYPQTATSFVRVTVYLPIENNKLEENIEKLIEFSKFENNWAGYNAEKFTQGLIKKVENIIKKLKYQPNIFPTGSGSIQLEYYKDDYNFLEMEVFNSQNANLFYSVAGKETGQIIKDKDIVSKLNELYKYFVK